MDLLNARFVQTDISYKRVVGFKELEFVGWDDHSHTTIVYCRAYMTHESAAAHLIFFRLLDQLVQKDTGESLRFRHLHSQSLKIEDRVGILHWAMDQGRGSAKGLALYLQELAAKLSGHDLHETHRYLCDLQPYEHLHRIARLCTAHVHRNISNSKSISEDIKHKMRSLMCIAHPNWDETISQIQGSGKAGRDWVADKISSKFAFEAMCQAKSFIPLDVWKAGPATTDLVESAHWSVYLEGIECSLTSAVEKGEHVDRLRLHSSQELKGIQVHAQTGIYTSNTPNDRLRSTLISHRRKADAESKRLDREDKQITSHNIKIDRAKMKVAKAHEKLNSLQSASFGPAAIERAKQSLEKAQRILTTSIEKGNDLTQTVQGSGSVNIHF
ncbi:hypothetical protein F5880DRAFT_1618593 [Lentinula raphanica]|nr:hypothetical protein F5880DRAFT_1618593 [Lentinula raphanica]